MGQALASWQAVPTLSTLHLSWARICMCPLRMEALGSTNLPWQPSVSEQSYPEGTSDTHRFNGTLLIYHFNPEARNWKKKGRKPFPFSHKLTCHWVTLPRNYLTPITLEENRLFICNGLRFHGSWSRGAQLHHHQDFTAQCPVACKARNDEKYRFCFSQGTNTLGCGLKESEFSYNQIYFFFLNRITDCFRVFLVSSMAPSKLCKVGCLVIQHLALWGGVPLVVKTLEKLAFFFFGRNVTCRPGNVVTWGSISCSPREAYSGTKLQLNSGN